MAPEVVTAICNVLFGAAHFVSEYVLPPSSRTSGGTDTRFTTPAPVEPTKVAEWRRLASRAKARRPRQAGERHDPS